MKKAIREKVEGHREVLEEEWLEKVVQGPCRGVIVEMEES